LRLSTLSLLLLSLSPLAAYDRSVQNFNQWFAYWGDHQIGKSKWGLHFDGHIRRNDLLTVRQQFLARPGVNYYLNKNVTLHAAYSWLPTYRYGAAPVLPQTENRLWHQVIVTHRQGKLQWFHRGRFEQRWLSRRYVDGETGPGSRIFEQRARYTLRATLPLRGPWYYSLGNEIFLPFPPENHPALVDQHRIQLTLGKRLSADMRLEFYYQYQNIWQRNGRIREDNHIAGIALWNAMPLAKLTTWLR
jgi:hypothetical protein